MFPSKKMWINQHFELSWKSTEIEIKLQRNIKLIQFSLFFQLIRQKKKKKNECLCPTKRCHLLGWSSCCCCCYVIIGQIRRWIITNMILQLLKLKRQRISAEKWKKSITYLIASLRIVYRILLIEEWKVLLHLYIYVYVWAFFHIQIKYLFKLNDEKRHCVRVKNKKDQSQMYLSISYE